MNSPESREETIVDAALDLPTEERTAFLDKACANDPGLREIVEGLLKAHLRVPFSPTESNQKLPVTQPAPVGEQPGDWIGPYKLLQQIGEGGCGVVFMAEQQEPVRRRVALKVIKLGMDTRQVIARFEAERQALALMDHPNIAKVLDAGATGKGRPYFVMELVRGIKLTDYCDQNNLSTPKRLEIFVQVCNAIQHAHQKGIIHRDIKPSNILVTLHDGVAVPKVIDFGIAKATAGQPLTDKTLFTAFEQFIGTPAYMSPEQAEMSGLDIDTRSDIYSLGVLLYELLTAKTPFDPKRLFGAALDEMRRIIREEEPPRPSTRLSTLAAGEQTTVAKHRQSQPPKLVHLVRGDLDWIVMKCLEKDRTRRYETTNALAMDVQRHLNNEPVIAVAPSALYKLQKFARRNKGPLAVVSAFAALLTAAAIVSSVLAVRANKASAEVRKHSERTAQALTRVQLEAAENLFVGNAAKALATLARLLREEPTNRVVAERLLNGLSSRSFRVPELPAFPKGTSIVRCSGDSRRIAVAMQTAQGSSVHVYGRDGNLLADLPHGAASIRDLDVAGDGTIVGTVAEDRLRVWSIFPRALLLDQPGTNGALRQVRILASQKRCLVLAETGVLLCQWEPANLLRQIHPSGSALLEMAISEPAGLVAISQDNGGIQFFDVQSLELRRQISVAHTGLINHIEFNADGTRLVSAGEDSFARLWDTQTSTRVAEFPHAAPVSWACFSPDGSRIVTASSDHSTPAGGSQPASGAQLWDVNGQSVGLWLPHPDEINTARFSPDGQSIVTACEGGTAREWQLADSSLINEPARFRARVLDAAFTPEGDGLLVLIEHQGAQLLTRTARPSWQVVKGTSPPPLAKLTAGEEAVLVRQATNITFVDVSPDGKFVAAACADKTARVWDRKTLQRIGEPLLHEAVVNCVRFSQDNQRLVTSTANHVVRVWDVRTSAPLTDPLRCDPAISGVWFAPDGRSILTDAGLAFPIHTIEGRAPDWLPELAEAIAGYRHNEERFEEALAPNAFLNLKAELAKRRETDPLTIWAQQFVNSGSRSQQLPGPAPGSRR